MKKRQLLLEAAAIVEKVDPNDFCMANLSFCALAHIGKRAGFKKLRHDILMRGDETHFIDVAARFFGISYTESEHLFGGMESRTPKREAQLLRQAAAVPTKRRKPRTPAGMKVIAQAINEAISVPAPRRRTRV